MAAARGEPHLIFADRSFFRHAGLAQAGEIGGFEQGADLRHPPIPRPADCSSGLHTRDAQKTIVGDQPASFGEFSGGAFGLAFEAIGCGELSAAQRVCRRSATPPFERDDCLIYAQLQQVRETKSAVKITDSGIVWAKAERLLLKRDRRVYLAGHQLAPRELVKRIQPVAVELESRF